MENERALQAETFDSDDQIVQIIPGRTSNSQRFHSLQPLLPFTIQKNPPLVRVTPRTAPEHNYVRLFQQASRT